MSPVEHVVRVEDGDRDIRAYCTTCDWTSTLWPTRGGALKAADNHVGEADFWRDLAEQPRSANERPDTKGEG